MYTKTKSILNWILFYLHRGYPIIYTVEWRSKLRKNAMIKIHEEYRLLNMLVRNLQSQNQHENCPTQSHCFNRTREFQTN